MSERLSVEKYFPRSLASRRAPLVFALSSLFLFLIGLSLFNTFFPDHNQAAHADSAVSLSGLHVQGNHFYNAAGQQVTLRGASRWGMEFSCTGDGHYSVSDFQAMKSWGMNAVRLPMNSGYWFGQNCSSTAYQGMVDQAVHNAEAAGLFVILVHQWAAAHAGNNAAMPPKRDLGFWQQVATKYANDPNVAFVAVTEPHDVSWQVWHDGDDQYAGMQDLVTTINTAAPNRIVFVNGLSWADDLTGLTNYPIKGSDIAYEVHIYQGWNPAVFADVATRQPVIAGEFGINDCSHNYVSQVMDYFERAQTGYFFWAWSLSGDGDCSPPILVDWNGTPHSDSQQYGLSIYNFYKAHADSTPTLATATNTSANSAPSLFISPSPTTQPSALRNGNGNGLAATPPMGYNPYNAFGNCAVTADLVKKQAQALIASGMKDVGYQYINIDDCWEGQRNGAGSISSDPKKFPPANGEDGIKVLADYIHSLGLSFGLYTDAGTITCAGSPGSYGYEQQDAQTYVSWGVDFVKDDQCHMPNGVTPLDRYKVMRDQLQLAYANAIKNGNTNARPVLFSLCSPGTAGPGIGNMWRMTNDIWQWHGHIWDNVVGNFEKNATYARYAGPGGWNDPDMLDLGNSYTDVQNQTHFSMWAISAAPLLAGNDLVNMSTVTRNILTNTDVIAVDQDPLGVQATLDTQDSQQGQKEVWVRPLQDGSIAVLLLNLTGGPADMTVSWSNTPLKGGSPTVRDLWLHENLGQFPNSYTAHAIPSNGVVMLRVGSGLIPSTSGLATPTTAQTTSASPTSATFGFLTPVATSQSITPQPTTSPTPSSTATPAATITPSLDGGTSYEAEAAVTSGIATVAPCNNGGCSGGHKVRYIGQDCTGQGRTAGTLTFTITSASARDVTMTISYINGDTANRTAFISVNGAPGLPLSFPPTESSWEDDTVGTLQVPIHLMQGQNTIKFYNDQSTAPDLDRISL